MDEEEPPPNGLEEKLSSPNYNHHIDEEGTLIEPVKEKSQIATLNPGLCQKQINSCWPFLFRTRRVKEGKGEFSTLDLSFLSSPTELTGELTTLISPEHSYESKGCEDPKLTHHNEKFYITYIAFDGINAVPALATTRDFQSVEKHGLLGPNIPLQEAIKVTDSKRYKERWEEQTQFREENDKQMIYTKDASLHYDPKRDKWIFIYRIEPDIQIAIADDIRELQSQDFWKEQIRNIDEKVVLRADLDDWSKEKVGIGSPPIEIDGRMIALYHGVEEVGKDLLIYRGSFLEFDENWRVKARIKSPLFIPDLEKHVIIEKDTEGNEKRKAVNFPTVILRNPEKPETLWIYGGLGDENIGYRSTELEWVLSELSREHSRLPN